MTAAADRPKGKSGSGAIERRGALWPWLVTPLLALILFYVLHTRLKVSTGDAAPAAVAGDTANPDTSDPHR